jgi:hypothetical protein
VLATVPEDGVRVTEEPNPLLEEVDTSKLAGADTVMLAARLAPDTENWLAAETAP